MRHSSTQTLFNNSLWLVKEVKGDGICFQVDAHLGCLPLSCTVIVQMIAGSSKPRSSTWQLLCRIRLALQLSNGARIKPIGTAFSDAYASTVVKTVGVSILAQSCLNLVHLLESFRAVMSHVVLLSSFAPT